MFEAAVKCAGRYALKTSKPMRRRKIKSKQVLICLACVCLSHASWSQDEVRRSKFSVYAEGGSSLFLNAASLNAEYTLFRSASEKFRLNARLGAGAGAVFYGPSGAGGLVGMTLLTGRKAHHFETNVGMYFFEEMVMGPADRWMPTGNYFGFPNFNLGYRFEKSEGGFLFKINAGIPGIGIGLGYAF